MKSYLADKAVGGGVGGGASIRALESALPFAVLSLREKEHGSSLVVIDSLLWHESLARRQQQRRRWSSERQIKAEEKWSQRVHEQASFFSSGTNGGP